MRILYFADIRFPLERANGIQTMETCHALAGRGHTVHLVVRPDTQSPSRDPFEYYGVPRQSGLVIETAPVPGPGLPAAARRLGYLAFAIGRAAGRGRADMIMTRDLTVAALLLSLPSRPPIVYEAHGYAPDVAAALPDMVATASAPGAAKIRRLARRESRVWSRADGYVTITSGLGTEMTTRFGTRQRLAVIPDGTRIPERGTNRDAAAPSSEIVVGYAGHLYAWKGVDLLVEALAHVGDVRGLIVGGHDREPDLDRLRQLAHARGVSDRVTFTGLVPPGEIPGQLARADILVLPNPASVISTRATSPLKLFEYMAAERAILASDLPSIREVLTHEFNAWLVAPGDPVALAAGIRHLAADATLRLRLAEAARDAVAEYSWNRRAERLEALFADVLAAQSSR